MNLARRTLNWIVIDLENAIHRTGVAARHPGDLIIMVLDRAGWHQRKAFSVPDNLRLFLLALYSPELNPVEHLWDELRERSFHSRVFSSLDALEKHLEIALQQIKLNCQRVRSSVARPWMANPFANPEME